MIPSIFCAEKKEQWMQTGEECQVLPSPLQSGTYSNYRVKRMNFDGRMSIGDLSKEAGVKVVTIRYYEQINLMPAPPRTAGNYGPINWNISADFSSSDGAGIWGSL